VGTLMEHRRPGIAPGSLEHRHREERPEVVVGHAQPGRQQPHHRPQHLVGDVAVEIEQQLEVERAMVISVHEVLAIASVERSERSKIAISPKQAPGLRTARASSPELGMVREMRTSPSEIMKSRLPGSPSLKTCWPTANFCSRQTSETRASSPSSRSWKIAACFSRLRFTRTKLWCTRGRGKGNSG